MEWDESRVYTALNADKLEIGSRVIVANTIFMLKLRVEKDCEFKTILNIEDESVACRFVTENNDYYPFAYLVSEPEKLKWTDLKIGDVIKHDNFTNMVTSIDSDTSVDMHILAGDLWITDRDLEDWEKVEND